MDARYIEEGNFEHKNNVNKKYLLMNIYFNSKGHTYFSSSYIQTKKCGFDITRAIFYNRVDCLTLPLAWLSSNTTNVQPHSNVVGCLRGKITYLKFVKKLKA
jgi:hypothetical protein